ncbi:MAG: hypothetical protein MUF00_04145 [Gemmatimonadaceae bacterium]|jgi:hypothetical protein|nr:hypothetical protein [Gemmatimonadaceae bacterium]
MFSLLIGLAILFGVSTLLHGATRRFVRDRLRYVDAVQSGKWPWIAGIGAALVAGPFAWLIPFVAAKGLAITAGLAVGMGVAAGARDIRNGTAPVVYGS